MVKITPVSPDFSVAVQPQPQDVDAIASAGFRSILCSRPDNEDPGQPNAETMSAAASAAGLAFAHVPITTLDTAPQHARKMHDVLDRLPGPILGYCRSGARSTAAYEAARALDGLAVPVYDAVIVGGGSAGLACAASLLKRRSDLSIAIVEPAEWHYYQPGWTLVGAGIFVPESTRRAMADVMPRGAHWIRQAVNGFDPHRNRVHLADGSILGYRTLVVAPGLTLDWDAIPGLNGALGQHGVTSNYRYDLPSYTRDLARGLKRGRALFTQPPMPIKCAGAPQKAMYLACHLWEFNRSLNNIDVAFHNAGGALFGVAHYVPALMAYIARYGIDLRLGSRLVGVDGPSQTASFEQITDGVSEVVERRFDMLHAVPPQVAPDFIRSSPLADPSGFVAVDPATLQHPDWHNVFALGDVAATSNAKTVAAARKQAPVVAVNALARLAGQDPVAGYNGYGSCPLTVERGKIVLAEFGYGGALLPSFPRWILDGRKPTRRAWFLKKGILPQLYWRGMLKGREWLATPESLGQDQ